MSEQLLRALSPLLPNAEFSVLMERAWHSATFAGAQVLFEAVLRCKNHDVMVTEFARILPDHEFDLCKQIVANIAVTRRMQDENATCLVIEALLLDD